MKGPLYYSSWQNPDWSKPFRKGPLERADAEDACQRRYEKRNTALIWLEDEKGNKELFQPVVKNN